MENPEIMIAAIAAIFAAVEALQAIVIATTQRKTAQRERAVQLYDDFYSAENYRRVVAPVMRLMLKWRGLPNDTRNAYRQAVRCGWLGFSREPEVLMHRYISPEVLQAEPYQAHFRDTLDAGCFTEHEALTVFLYFWTKVHNLLEAKVINRNTTHSLLRVPFQYYAGFIAELRDDTLKNLGVGDVEPAWSSATRALERFFD
ncbi:MAG: hypothetical protein Tsb0016_27230 [Sphingomonadales bacterium]